MWSSVGVHNTVGEPSLRDRGKKKRTELGELRDRNFDADLHRCDLAMDQSDLTTTRMHQAGRLYGLGQTLPGRPCMKNA